MLPVWHSDPSRLMPVRRQASSTETEVPIRGFRDGASVFLGFQQLAISGLLSQFAIHLVDPNIYNPYSGIAGSLRSQSIVPKNLTADG